MCSHKINEKKGKGKKNNNNDLARAAVNKKLQDDASTT
jgi:hypothetical protein